eukprot:12760005-Prorocentrum_lima.AAC.1
MYRPSNSHYPLPSSSHRQLPSLRSARFILINSNNPNPTSSSSNLHSLSSNPNSTLWFSCCCWWSWMSVGFGLENTTINNNNHEQQQHAERQLMMSNGSEFDRRENEAPFIIGRYMCQSNMDLTRLSSSVLLDALVPTVIDHMIVCKCLQRSVLGRGG